jgi:hypothetical protein
MSYEPDFESAISEILALKFGVSEDIIDLLSLTCEEETGNDGEHYGWYVEIPSLNRLDDATKQEMFNALLSKIPFGDTEYISDFQLSETCADPLNSQSDYYEYQYYSAIEFSKELITQLNEIAEKISLHLQAKEELTVKALILSAFSLTESHVREHVWNLLPKIDESVSNVEFRGILRNHFFNKLQRIDNIRSVHKQFTGKEMDDIPNREPFRNSLAHDIGAGRLDGTLLIVKNKKGEEIKVDVFELINELIVFWRKLREEQ